MDAQSAASDSNRIAVIVTGGDPVGPDVIRHIPDTPKIVIAADSGLDHAVAVGLAPTVVIGDLDSVSQSALDAFRAGGGEVLAHPTDKDDTDLALAIDLAIDRNVDHIIVLGGAGQRLSHVLGNCAAIAHAVRRGIGAAWHFDGATVHVVAANTPVTVTGSAGDLVSLLPFAGRAVGVTTSGLRWRLDGDDLESDATRGVSNEMTTTHASITVAHGLVFVVHERNHDT